MLYKQMFVIQAFFSIGGGGNWVNFWQIYAAGISEPLPNYSLFCSQEDPISVAFEQKFFFFFIMFFFFFLNFYCFYKHNADLLT